MFSRETLRTAHTWYHLGVGWIEREALNQGLAHLDKALTVFEENGELRMATLARHQKLFGCVLGRRYEEAESLFSDVLRGYTALADRYGEVLLLAHFGQTLMHQDRWPLALSWWNVAQEVAQEAGLPALQAYVQMQQAQVMQQRELPLQAVRLLESSRTLLENQESLSLLSTCLYQLAQAQRQLGESARTIALLEDLHARLMRARLFHEALEPLKMLSECYQETGMDEERAHTTRKLHFAAQQMLQSEPQRKATRYLGPQIGADQPQF